MHHLSPSLLAAFTAAVLIIELAVPFLVWLPRPWRLFAAWSFILLQGSILLTGNFAFFNLLALALYLFLFEDRDLGRLPGRGVLRQSPNTDGPPSQLGQASAGFMAGVVLFTCGTLAGLGQAPGAMPEPLYRFARTVTDFGLVNGYGPFAVMTTERRELQIEGSRDGMNWSTYGFRYKPDAYDQPLGWNIPHQPRLDWQFWFAALGDPAAQPWLAAFLQRLRENSAPVLGLLRHNPFPDEPPRYVRVVVERYHFTSPDERALNGRIWRQDRRVTD